MAFTAAITIDNLITEVESQRDIPRDAAEEIVYTYAGQISGDEDLYGEAENTRHEVEPALSEDGAAIVRQAIDDAYAQGIHSTGDDLRLEELEAVAAEIRKAQEAVRENTERRDQLISYLMRTSVARSRIALAADVKEARLYQIRDGRR